jgi:uncharacterized protein YqjF (DUF2071 family)
MPRPFLTARWQHLIFLNWSCPAELLTPLVPEGTMLDRWQGEAVISLIGFLFADTRVLGVPIPFHRTFEEVNLRFYVRREAPDRSVRRGVVFIRELVPRWAIAAVARRVYNEPYRSVPMDHRIQLSPSSGGEASYSWRVGKTRYSISGRAIGPAQPARPGADAEFVTEHYWGYTRQRDGTTLEYPVEHPRWQIWETALATWDGPPEELYGPALGPLVAAPPRSTFMAVGSEVAVYPGSRL